LKIASPHIEVPGMESDDFDIQVVDDVLVVRGEQPVEREGTQGRYHVTEQAYATFERAVQLPAAVDEERARAAITAAFCTFPCLAARSTACGGSR
jgi:HSP20 family molecular chaperone IbpA